jgi:alkylation response protein AidB-like acyl-CoA dehydrogenase
MDDLEAFRNDIRRWVDDHAPGALRGKLTDPDHQVWGGLKEQRTPEQQAWLSACIERGFTAPTWPKAYGGVLAAARARSRDHFPQRAICLFVALEAIDTLLDEGGWGTPCAMRSRSSAVRSGRERGKGPTLPDDSNRAVLYA